MKKAFNIIYRFWPFIFIIFFWFLFSSPYFLNNSVPFPSKYLVNNFGPWNAYEGFTSPVKNNAMPDVISQIYPWKTLTIDSYKNFSIPLWNPFVFSGMPLMANYQSAIFSPLNLIFFILPFIDAWSILVLLQPLLAALFMYWCLRSFNLSRQASLMGSIAFMFCGFLVTWMAYATLGYAILFLPLSIGLIQEFYLQKKTRFLIFLGLTIPLSFFSGHFQISLYFLLAVFLFAFFKFLTNRNIKDFLLVLFFIFSGLLVSLIQIVPTIELYSQSLRSGIFQKIEAIPWNYLPTFFAPDFFGNPVTRNDWFGHYAEWNAYVGVIPLIFAIYALFRKQTKQILFFVFLATIAILFSFSTPFLDLLIALKVPVLSTSAASRMIVIFSFSISVLAAFGFDLFLKDFRDKNLRIILVTVSFVFLIFLSLWLVILFKLFLPMDKIIIAKQNLILPTIIFISFACLSVAASFIRLKKIKIGLLVGFVFLLITAFDLLRFSTKWMPFEPKNLVYPNVPIVKEFNNINKTFRVFGPLTSEAVNYYRLLGIEGYDALFVKRYGEFISSLEKGKLSQSQRSVVSLPKNGINTSKAINLLGIKYIVNKKSDGQAVWNFPYWTYSPDTFVLIYEDLAYQILENTKVFDRAFLVNKYVVKNSPQEILNTMFSNKFNLEKEVVLEKSINKLIDENAIGSTKILEYLPNKVKIQTSSTGNSILFLSDAYYPGWNAYVDGVQTEVYRANYSFRSVLAPKGAHIIEFKYEPSSLLFGFYGLLLGVAILGLSVVLSFKRLFGFPKF